jgi:hypothetical protein
MVKRTQAKTWPYVEDDAAEHEGEEGLDEDGVGAVVGRACSKRSIGTVR